MVPYMEPLKREPMQHHGTRSNKKAPVHRGKGLDFGAPWDAQKRTHIWSIITWPKPEQLTCVAPSIRRAKS